MKRLVLILCLLISIRAAGQWNLNGAQVYTFNSVSIGTSTATGNKFYVVGNSYFTGNATVGGAATFNGLLTANGGIRGAGSSGLLRISTLSGYLDMGAQNSSWAHFYTDRPQYYFNRGITVDEGRLSSYDEDLLLQTSGTTRLTVLNSNGNVGIGNPSPQGKLDIDAGGNYAIRTKSTSRYLVEVRNASDPGGWWLVNDPNGSFALHEDGIGDHFTIAPGGNIGIGTSTPGGKLDINRANGQLRLSGGTIAAGVWTNTQDMLYLADWNTGSKGLNINMTTGNVGIGVAANAKLDILGPPTGNGITIRAAGGGDVMLNSGGSLFFDGNYSYASGNYIRPIAPNTQAFFTSGTERMHISPDGKIGVGISSPAEQLHIASPGSTYISIDKGSDAGEAGLTFNRAQSVLFYLFNDDSDNALKIRATGQTGENDGAPRMQFPFSSRNIYMAQSGGNVGIGTSTPNFKLDVNGSINASSIYLNGVPFLATSQWQTSGSNISYGSGSVGIGTSLTSNPNSYLLAVNGKIGAKEVRVETSSTAWPDYVFDNDYNLPALDSVEVYIREHRRLEGIPSASEVKAQGHDLGSMDALLLRKIEELTLYVIQQEKLNKQQGVRIRQLEAALNEIKKNKCE